MKDRLQRQIDFLVEIDKLKTIYRRAYLAADPQRRENSAEHSWHVSVIAMVLGEFAPPEVDISRVIRLLLVHDIVEIDAGDTGIYDKKAFRYKNERENRAAERIFSLLPEDQCQELKSLWQEYESGTSPEATFARAVDRLMPLLHNYYTGGKRWREDGITFEQVYAVNRIISQGSPRLWQLAQNLIRDSQAKGYLT
ncbi:MAG: HD domain-containing protein [Dehalococcoidales bacterium]|nr:HD domain-containing protein [Dehalococcoidales bacterium]